MVLNHVAVLVPSLDRAERFLAHRGLHMGPREEFAAEGTIEVYVGEPACEGRLLLMQPVAPGAYSRAMAKRGPGLHHVAVDVLNLEDYVGSLAGSGWLLHPVSLKSIRTMRTAWCARPGMPLLLEVQERDALMPGTTFVRKVEVAAAERERTMLTALGVDSVLAVAGAETHLTLAGCRFSIPELIG